MAWPKSGTVSVTNGSAVVTGTGTSFFGSAQAGWAFVGPDGRVYEVLTVDSSTQITLASPYQGAQAGGQVYALFPTMSLAHDLVASVQALISNYQTIADGPGAGKFAGDVVKQGDEDTGLSWPASNTVALKSGGTEQLRLTNGQASGAAVQASATDTGTDEKLVRVDGARAAASRNYGGYYSAGSGVNIDTVSAGFVGLVSDSNAGTWPLAPFGGFVWVDTQAIYSGEAVLQRAVYGYGGTVPGEPVSFERVRANSGGGWSAWVRQTPVRDSNANGEYVKLPEGTLICTHSLALTGGGSVTITGTWVFPHPFIANPKVSVVSEAAPPAGTRERTYWNSGSPTGVNINASMNVNWPASTSEIHAVTAIGRWK